jgi:hypothetical protein
MNAAHRCSQLSTSSVQARLWPHSGCYVSGTAAALYSQFSWIHSSGCNGSGMAMTLPTPAAAAPLLQQCHGSGTTVAVIVIDFSHGTQQPRHSAVTRLQLHALAENTAASSSFSHTEGPRCTASVTAQVLGTALPLQLSQAMSTESIQITAKLQTMRSFCSIQYCHGTGSVLYCYCSRCQPSSMPTASSGDSANVSIRTLL